MILVVASARDVASMNIQKQLLAHYDFEEVSEKFHDNPVYLKTIESNDVKLVTIEEEAIYYQGIKDSLTPLLIIYISRHSSESGIPTLSVHTPGNLAEAEKGGLPRRISIAPAKTMREALLEMEKQRDALSLSYKVSYECTHHGPSLDVATMFVELGSSPTQWKDVKAAEAVAHTVIASISKHSESSTAAVGIGGPHYNEKFTSMALQGSVAFGHMIPKYAVSQVDAEVIRQCVERTAEKVETIILDWKGITGADKPGLMKALAEVDMPVQKV